MSRRKTQSALDRFLFDLLDKEDEIFLYRFSNYPVLLQGWTTDRQLRQAAPSIASRPNGGTAMYDAVAEAIPLAQEGQFRKKALVVISDGNDTGSRTTIRELKQQIRESEVLVYAIGIDGESEPDLSPRASAAATATTADSISASRFRAGRAAILRFSSAAQGRLAHHSRRRSRQCRRASGHDRRQRRPHGNRPRRARSQPRDREHRRRAEQAVLPRLSGVREERRTLALDSSRSAERPLHRPGTQGVRRELEYRVPLLATALGLSLLGSCGGLVVASSLLLFTDAVRTRLLPWLVSYAVGALLGVALLALLPEALTL